MTSTATDLTGTAILTRFIVRRDRVRIVVWVASIAALVAVTAASVKGLYPTQADLDQAAARIAGECRGDRLQRPGPRPRHRRR